MGWSLGGEGFWGLEGVVLESGWAWSLVGGGLVPREALGFGLLEGE